MRINDEMNEMILSVRKQFKQLYFFNLNRLQQDLNKDFRDTGALLYQLSCGEALIRWEQVNYTLQKMQLNE